MVPAHQRRRQSFKRGACMREREGRVTCMPKTEIEHYVCSSNLNGLGRMADSEEMLSMKGIS